MDEGTSGLPAEGTAARTDAAPSAKQSSVVKERWSGLLRRPSPYQVWAGVRDGNHRGRHLNCDRRACQAVPSGRADGQPPQLVPD
jgi:hypothetical protein